jgi:hypothetical protein
LPFFLGQCANPIHDGAMEQSLPLLPLRCHAEHRT